MMLAQDGTTCMLSQPLHKVSPTTKRIALCAPARRAVAPRPGVPPLMHGLCSPKPIPHPLLPSGGLPLLAFPTLYVLE